MSRKSESEARYEQAKTIYDHLSAAREANDLRSVADRLNELSVVFSAPTKGLPDLPEIAASDTVTWDKPHTIAAMALAEGRTQAEAGEEAGVSARSIRNWLQNECFSTEVDRLSLMLGISCRAERLRLAKRVIRQKTVGSTLKTDKDVLDWLKFAQSETDGVKLDITKLAAAFGENETPLADSRQDRGGEPRENTELVN